MKAALLLSLAALAGCMTPHRSIVVTRTPDGLDIAATRPLFESRWRHAMEQSGQPGDLVIWGGVYDGATHACWVVARDPYHLTESERWNLAHEHAHRVAALHGFEAAAPLWAIIPASHRSHADIEARLEREHWLP